MKTISQREFRELESSYQRANYVVHNKSDRIVIRIGEANSELDALLRLYKTEAWAFVTAHNPYSCPLSMEENQNRNTKLVDRLKRANLKFFEGYGESPTGDWEPETSFLILNIARDKAIELGHEFEQNAIVAGVIEDRPQLVWCLVLGNS